MEKIRFLNGNAIKILALILMTVDHVGFLLFPNLQILRLIGRVSFPLFAYMLAEGCHYTKNKIKHFLLVFVLGILFQLVYQIATNDASEYNIFLTFALSILAIYSLQYAKEGMFQEGKFFDKLLSLLQFPLVILTIYVLSEQFPFDYGFFGILLPVFVSLFDDRGLPQNRATKVLSCSYVKIFMLAIGLLFVCLTSAFKERAFYSYLSIPILLFYNEKKGKYNLKYLFYFYYPLHLVLLQAVQLLLFLLQ